MDYPNNNFISHSPAQYVILDVGIPTPANITANVLTTLESVLCLGSGNVPVIGVALINATFEQVISLTSTKSHLHKILQALKTVIDTVTFRARISMEEFQDNIYMGVKRALEDFQSLPQKLENNIQCPVELQVMIMSMKNGSEIQYYTQRLLTALPTEHLKKIQVIELVHDYVESEISKSCSGFIECLRVPGSLARLDELMKQWLLRGPTEQEDVRIVLQDCLLLCDFQQCLIRPSFSNTKTLETNEDLSGGLKPDIGTIHLEVTHRLASDGICETQMCGDPVVLVPSQCYRLTWPEQQVNQQYYLTLIEKLTMIKEYLVTKVEVKGQPLKYFILMPGEDFILMRSLVTAEVVLPFPGKLMFQIDQEIDNNTTEALLSVPALQAYNPADFVTGLHKKLLEAALHPARDKAQGGLSRTHSLTHTQEPLCKDPAHRSLVVGIEIKKTVKRKKSSGMKFKKNASNDLPKLSLSDQQTLTEFFSRQTKKYDKINTSCKNSVTNSISIE